MTTTAEKAVEAAAPAAIPEKRKALGRGLESLLPAGPRAVPGAGTAPAAPDAALIRPFHCAARSFAQAQQPRASRGPDPVGPDRAQSLPDALSLRPRRVARVGGIDSDQWRSSAGGGAARRGTLSADSGRAALPGFEAGGKNNRPGYCPQSFRPASRRNDCRRKPAASGSELHGASRGVCQTEPRFRIDPGANRATGWDLARVGLKLYAAAEAAGIGDAISARGTAGIQRSAGSADTAGCNA